MKNKNVWHITWIISIYAVLMTILYLVVEYKVKWEDKDLSTYLYFYKCSNQLCTTEKNVANYYSKVKCNKKECPYITEKNNNYLILSNNEKEYVYDYIKGNIISDIYNKYSFINNNLIAKSKDGKYGVIDFEGNVLVNFDYNKIIDYKDSYVAYSENSKVGIINKERDINIEPTYEYVKLINDSIYTYREDNKYYIASYETELPVNNENYDYVYGTENIIITIKNKKLNIMDTNLKSKLLLMINTFYEYSTEKERDSLNIYLENNLLHFNIINDNNITYYIYDIKNNKLYS